jgi:hypothetical protein
MIERYLHQVRVEMPAADESAAGARERLAAKFPRNAVRRMTHLGMLVGAALDGTPLGPDDAVVLASTFAETLALEDFLMSFPQASPMLFQTSIHPGSVQQVLIGRQQPVARLWPCAGRARLVEHAILTALLEHAARVALVGGEERGIWTLEHGVASARSFAFATVLTSDAAEAAGRVSFQPNDLPDGPCPTLERFADALAAHAPLFWQGAGGAFNMEWL